MATGSTFASVNKNTLNNLDIPFFDRLKQAAIGRFLRSLVNQIEQEEIVAVLDAIDRKIDLHRRKRAVLDDLFKALLHNLMTGQTRVADFGLLMPKLIHNAVTKAE